ncbi:MAG: ABC transporter permease [Flavobacteriaceae bacterium]|nr:ABC transporter permease [Flavobacteriaceae bacterium]
MFDLDRWQEIFSSIRSNMLRTVLSGFTVALGLYIFIVLFGIGTGLKNAFNDGFRSSQNLISISSGRTSLAYAGLQADRLISFNNDDLEAVTTENKENIEYSSPIYSSFWTVKYGKESGSYGINGAGEEEVYIKNRTVLDGRYLSPADIKENRNVAVIGKMVHRDLIKNGNPIGKELDINGTIFKVIGIFSDNQGDWAERSISIPITTMQQLKKSSDTISEISLTYNMELSPDEAIQFGEELKNQLQERKKVSPEDEQAIWVFNNAENTKNGTMFLSVIIIIVGFIGIGTLVAGIIGISNIMVYIVKERTLEIGIRKAIGARPISIVVLILQESIVITVLSGIIGVILGVLSLRLIGNNLRQYFILDPNVGWGAIFSAFVCLVISGAVAGFVPAYRASKIKPIEALRG